MNIPPDSHHLNDLNRGPPPPPPHPIFGPLQNFFTAIINANREWTDAKDLAFRLTIPLFSMAAVALINQQLEKRDLFISEEEKKLQLAKSKLEAEQKTFAAEKATSLNRPLVQIVNELMAQENRKSYKALQEIESLQPLIKDVLAIRCSMTTPRDQRAPIEKQIRARILNPTSPLAMFGDLKTHMLEDSIEIVKKDIAHCDAPWPLGRGNNGELYKVYRDNWRLRVELEKHKHVIEHLKRLSRTES